MFVACSDALNHGINLLLTTGEEQQVHENMSPSLLFKNWYDGIVARALFTIFSSLLVLFCSLAVTLPRFSARSPCPSFLPLA